MKTSYNDQINAIKIAMLGATLLVTDDSRQAFSDSLNDAASTIAALNLTKDLPKQESSLVFAFPEKQSSQEENTKRILSLEHEIRMLIEHAEQETLTYSVLEHARKMIFKP